MIEDKDNDSYYLSSKIILIFVHSTTLSRNKHFLMVNTFSVPKYKQKYVKKLFLFTVKSLTHPIHYNYLEYMLEYR
jgi:hypothetical protein